MIPQWVPPLVGAAGVIAVDDGLVMLVGLTGGDILVDGRVGDRVLIFFEKKYIMILLIGV